MVFTWLAPQWWGQGGWKQGAEAGGLSGVLACCLWPQLPGGVSVTDTSGMLCFCPQPR